MKLCFRFTGASGASISVHSSERWRSDLVADHSSSFLCRNSRLSRGKVIAVTLFATTSSRAAAFLSHHSLHRSGAAAVVARRHSSGSALHRGGMQPAVQPVRRAAHVTLMSAAQKLNIGMGDDLYMFTVIGSILTGCLMVFV